MELFEVEVHEKIKQNVSYAWDLSFKRLIYLYYCHILPIKISCKAYDMIFTIHISRDCSLRLYCTSTRL
jgi:hypothetical protein